MKPAARSNSARACRRANGLVSGNAAAQFWNRALEISASRQLRNAFSGERGAGMDWDTEAMTAAPRGSGRPTHEFVGQQALGLDSQQRAQLRGTGTARNRVERSADQHFEASNGCEHTN